MNSVTKALASLTPPSKPLAPAIPESRLLTAFHQPTAGPAGGGVFAVHFGEDLSGSTYFHHPVYLQAESGFVNGLLADPLLADRVRLCVTKMSGRAVSGGYYPPEEFQTPAVVPGGISPHGELLTAMMAADLADWEALKRGGVAVDLRVHVLMVDGHSSDCVKRPTADYHRHQRENRVHVFPVEMGDGCNPDFMSRISLHHEPFPNPDLAIKAVFDRLLQLLKRASRDLSEIDAVRSLDVAGLPKPQA